jgi:transposase
METQYFLGIDVGKDTFHATVTIDGQNFYDQEVKNTTTAIKAYFQDLKATFRFTSRQLIVCMEHTGIYGYPLLDYLTKNSIDVCVEAAIQIKQSQGLQRGKNDRIDSKRIARYVYKNYAELKLWKPKREVIQNLRALLIVRERLVTAKPQFEVPVNESKDSLRRQ